jgi:cob(I)alamin adenosyltransferase
VDEANSAIGVVIAEGHLNATLVQLLTRVQNDLFDVGADLSTPVADDPGHPPLRITKEYVDRLEGWCDSYNERLSKLRSFVLPGGTTGAAYLHVARTVVRRAERSAWAAVEAHGPAVNQVAITYLNRLSDLLFILARVANLSSGGDVLWVPGGEREKTS